MNSLLHRLQIALGLSLAEWAILIEAWGELLSSYFLMRRNSFESLSAQEPTLKSLQSIPIEPHRLYDLNRYASRLHFLPMTCLPQSLALRNLLAKRGVASKIEIGVKKTHQGIHAHAWVVVDGAALENDEVEERFYPLTPTN